MNDELKLLVEWSSPWEEFVTAIRPALGRSAKPLDAETHSGLFPYRGGLPAMVLEIVLLIALIVLPSKLARIQPSPAAPPPQYDVIYFSGNELPRTEDNAGARSGQSGRSGGNEGHHPTQVIRVARGAALRDQIVDAPKLNLPHSDAAVANLLAYKSVPGPPPASGLEASSRVADMQAQPIPPPAAMQPEKLHAAPALEANVIAPSPNTSEHEVTSRRIATSNINAVPPTVSAPRAVAISNPKLTLPQSMVVRPTPSQLAHESARARFGESSLENQQAVAPAPAPANGFSTRHSVNVGDASVVAPAAEVGNVSARQMPGSIGDSKVVPPPAQVNGSLVRQANGISQTASVVQPMPAAGSATGSRRSTGSLGDSKAVPPPAQVNGSLQRQTNGFSQTASVIQPSPSAPSGSVTNGHRTATGLEEARAVPPTAKAGGSLVRRGSGFSQSDSVVQPPPEASSGSGSTGRGRARSGPGDSMAEAAVPPSPGLASGIVLSSRPGSKLASPNASAGSMAMSPSGGATPGLGGTGGGTGISHGTGSGSSTSGTGSGSKTDASGQGSNETAHNGISPFPGTGGAGKGTLTPPAMPGVSVSGGGSNTITLPSFGTDKTTSADPSHSPAINSDGPAITVVATSHSGGAFNFYGALKGDKVYTIYIDTTLGTAVMQFADPKSVNQTYPQELTAPQALRAELPSDVSPSRLVIACTLDRSGVLKTARVLEGNSPELSEKVLAELPKWKFRPAFRGSEPVEVNAILGFDIDTR